MVQTRASESSPPLPLRAFRPLSDETGTRRISSHDPNGRSRTAPVLSCARLSPATSSRLAYRRVKGAEQRISAGLLVTAISGTASTIALWRVDYGVITWSAAPAVAHPVWLGVGVALGIVAAVAGSISLGALAFRYGRSSALAMLGVICAGFAVAGAIVTAVLDFALIVAAQDGVIAAIEFRLRWTWWNGLGWALFAIGGLIAVLAIGISVARSNRRLRYPALSLAVAAALLAVYPAAGAPLFAAALVWLASMLARSDSSVVSLAR